MLAFTFWRQRSCSLRIELESNGYRVVFQGVSVCTHPYWTAVDTSYSVQWNEYFPKGQETEEKPNISKLMKYN
jgi:hypothetical protein